MQLRVLRRVFLDVARDLLFVVGAITSMVWLIGHPAEWLPLALPFFGFALLLGGVVVSCFGLDRLPGIQRTWTFVLARVGDVFTVAFLIAAMTAFGAWLLTLLQADLEVLPLFLRAGKVLRTLALPLIAGFALGAFLGERLHGWRRGRR